MKINDVSSKSPGTWELVSAAFPEILNKGYWEMSCHFCYLFRTKCNTEDQVDFISRFN